MVYQIRAGYAVAGMEIKVPQVFIPRLMRTTILARTLTGSKQLNQIHTIAPVSPVTIADVTAVNGLVGAWVASAYNTCYSDGIEVEAVHTRSMEALIVPTITQNLSVFGTLNGDMLPFDKSLDAEFTANLTGQENVGAFYPFTPTELQNDANGFPFASYVAIVQAALNHLVSNMVSGGYPLVIASYTYQSFVEVTGVVIRRQWGTQRRRLTQYGQ